MTKTAIKAKAKTSRTYLKILGTILMVLAGVGTVFAIALFFININLDELSLGDALTELRKDLSDTAIKNLAAGVILFSMLLDLLVGWLIRRASRPDGKTTAAFVLVVLECISAAYTLFSAGFASPATAIGNIITLTIYVLAFIAILNVRQANEG